MTINEHSSKTVEAKISMYDCDYNIIIKCLSPSIFKILFQYEVDIGVIVRHPRWIINKKKIFMQH